MLELQVKQVDAFTTEPLAGNPAAVVLDADELSTDVMQRIAREMNLSETAFVMASDQADFRVRFFTPGKEIDLAGHPTIATFHALAEEGRVAGEGEVVVTQELNIGVLPVTVEIENGQPQRAIMDQQPPDFLATHNPAPWVEALGIQPTDLVADVPIQTVSTGTPQVMVPLNSLDVLHNLRPDFRALTALTNAGDFFSIHIFTRETLDPAADAHARHFAPAAGVDEDPVTGSASGGMACYLAHYGLTGKRELMFEQGDVMGRPGRVYAWLDEEADEITRVRIGGAAVTVMDGTLWLDL